MSTAAVLIALPFVLWGAVYLWTGRLATRLFALMLVTLPLQAAYVFDVGMNVRIPYLLGTVALVLALNQGTLRHPRSARPLKYLWVFVVLVLLSVAQTMRIEVFTITSAGLRGTPLRPVIQVLQLLMLVGILYLTMSRCRTKDELERIGGWILAGSLLPIAYGMYEVLAIANGWPYVDLRNTVNTNLTRGFIDHSLGIYGIEIPRPRATFVEPLNLANFLVLAFATAWVTLRSGRGVRRILAGVVLVAGGVVFLLANSRGALFGVATAGIFLLLFVNRLRSVWAGVRGLFFAVVLAAVVLAAVSVIVPGAGPEAFIEMSRNRLLVSLEDRNRQFYQVSWEIFRAHPVLGVGLGNHPFVAARLSGDENSWDPGMGDYSRLLAETGLLGTGLYVMFLASAIFGLVRAGRSRTGDPTVRRFAAAVAFALVADAVQRVSFGGVTTDTHLWVMLGLAVAIPRLAQGANGRSGANGSPPGTPPALDAAQR